MIAYHRRCLIINIYEWLTNIYGAWSKSIMKCAHHIHTLLRAKFHCILCFSSNVSRFKVAYSAWIHRKYYHVCPSCRYVNKIHN